MAKIKTIKYVPKKRRVFTPKAEPQETNVEAVQPNSIEPIKQENTMTEPKEASNEFNRYAEEVIEREHSKPVVIDNIPDIKEPVFERPDFSAPEEVDTEDPFAQKMTNEPPKSPVSEIGIDNNSNVSQEPTDEQIPMDSEQIDTGASVAVDAVLNMGCGLLNMLAHKLIKVSEKELRTFYQKGWIDDKMIFRFAEHQVTAAEWFSMYNEKVDREVSICPDDFAKVRPLIEEYFKEKGLALSPGWAIIVGIGQPIGAFGIAAVQCYAEKKSFSNQLGDIYEQNKIIIAQNAELLRRAKEAEAQAQAQNQQ